MEIQINEFYRISSDHHNWKLEEKHVGKKGERWKVIGYFTKLQSVVDAYPEIVLKRSEVKGITEALRVVKEACKQLTGALSPKYEVVLK